MSSPNESIVVFVDFKARTCIAAYSSPPKVLTLAGNELPRFPLPDYKDRVNNRLSRVDRDVSIWEKTQKRRFHDRMEANAALNKSRGLKK